MGFPVQHSPTQGLETAAALSNKPQLDLNHLDRLVAENLKLREELELLAFAISHDLTTPIRHINQFVGLALEEVDQSLDPKVSSYLNKASGACQSLNGSIQALLSYSRIGRQYLHWEAVKLDSFFEELLDPYRAEIVEQGGGIEVHAMSRPWFTDFKLFHRLFVELISNSIQFAHVDRPLQLRLSLKVEENRYIFEVSDNGIGIPKESLPHLFELFRPLHMMPQLKEPGLGCGLAFCARIVERLGGEIQHIPGKQGTCFQIRLPMMIHPPEKMLPESLVYDKK